jgi:hypothetical protein
MRLKESRLQGEMRAKEKDIKASILFEYAHGQEDWTTVDYFDSPLDHSYSLYWRNRTKEPHCLGTSEEVVSWAREMVKYEDELTIHYKKELEGLTSPSLQLAVDQYCQYYRKLTVVDSLFSNLNTQHGYMGGLYNNGEGKTVEMMLRSAASVFHAQASRVSDKNLVKEKNDYGIHGLFEPWAVMQAAIFYLDPALLPRFNQIMERRYLTLISEKFWTLPGDNDGV